MVIIYFHNCPNYKSKMPILNLTKVLQNRLLIYCNSNSLIPRIYPENAYFKFKSVFKRGEKI